MLIVRAYINDRPIEEELHIQRISEGEEEGEFKYAIRKPQGYQDVLIIHRYVDGWMVLAQKAIRFMEMKDIIRMNRLNPDKPLALPESKSQTRRKEIQRRK